MPTPLDLTRNDMLALTRPALAALRAALMRDAGPAAASYLQEAGYAGGERLFAAFRQWLHDRGDGAPEHLDLELFEKRASEFFRLGGWGTLRIGSLQDAVATLDSQDWGEADPQSGLDQPACHFTTGMFADFFGRLAESPLAVFEIECRSAGADRCRFLVGAPDTMQHVFDEMSRGVSVEEAVAGVE